MMLTNSKKLKMKIQNLKRQIKQVQDVNVKGLKIIKQFVKYLNLDHMFNNVNFNEADKAIDELCFKILKLKKNVNLAAASAIEKISIYIKKVIFISFITAIKESGKTVYSVAMENPNEIVFTIKQLLNRSLSLDAFLSSLSRLYGDAGIVFKHQGLFKGLATLITYDLFYILSALLFILFVGTLIYYIYRFIKSVNEVDLTEEEKQFVKDVAKKYDKAIKNISLKRAASFIIIDTITYIFKKIYLFFKKAIRLINKSVTNNPKNVLIGILVVKILLKTIFKDRPRTINVDHAISI